MDDDDSEAKSVVKARLSKIVKHKFVLDRIREDATRTHHIAQRAYDCFKLYVLHAMSSGQDEIKNTMLGSSIINDDSFYCQFFKACSRRVQGATRGRKPSANQEHTRQMVFDFYDQHFAPLLPSGELAPCASNLAQVLKFQAKQLKQTLTTGIARHFVTRVHIFVDRSFRAEELAMEALGASKETIQQFRKKLTVVKRLLLDGRKDSELPSKPPGIDHDDDARFREFVNVHRPKILPANKRETFGFAKELVAYDVKVKNQTLAYLPGTVYLGRQLELLGNTPTGRPFAFHAVPLKTSLAPGYIMLDTQALLEVFGAGGRFPASYRKQVRTNAPRIWRALFKSQRRPFVKKSTHTFSHCIVTDGYGASIIRDRVKKAKEDPVVVGVKRKRSSTLAPSDQRPTGPVQRDAEVYITDVPTSAVRAPTKWVTVDPNRRDLMYATDGQVFWRYTSNQKARDERTRHFRKLRLRHLPPEVQALQHEWSELPSAKTCDIVKFSSVVQSRHASRSREVMEALARYRELLTRLRWSGYVHRQRAESRLVRQFVDKFGGPKDGAVALAWGDWDQGSRFQQHHEPIKGVGMRNIFRKAGYPVYMVDEHRTSCTCHSCGSTAKMNTRVVRRANPRPYRRASRPEVWCHGLLGCENCGLLHNRDKNAVMNMQLIVRAALDGGERPLHLRREAKADC